MMPLAVLAVHLQLRDIEQNVTVACAKLLESRSVESLEAQFKDLMRTREPESNEVSAAKVFYACLLLQGSTRKRLTTIKLSQYGMRIDRLASKEYSATSTKLLQGWWLQTCAPLIRMRTDAGRKAYEPVLVNGKRVMVEGTIFDTDDPAIEKGKTIIAKALAKNKTSPLALHYRLRSPTPLPISGPDSVRSAFQSLSAPYRFLFLKELVFRDANSKDAGEIKKEWLQLTSSKDRSFVIQYLMAAEPKQ